MDDDDLLTRSLVRSVKTPSQGNLMQAQTGGFTPPTSPKISTVVGTDGKVRRLWGPGDPWNDNFFFGGGGAS